MVCNVHEAKSRLSELIRAVFDGEDVIIAKAGKPQVRLVAIPTTDAPPAPGRFVDEITIHEDTFFAPLPEDELASWEG